MTELATLGLDRCVGVTDLTPLLALPALKRVSLRDTDADPAPLLAQGITVYQ
jgi:hypothetical protein